MNHKAANFEALLQKSDDDLFDEVGQLTQESYKDGSSLEALGLGVGSLRDLGTAIFARLHRELHGLICGDGADEKERAKLKKILSLDAAAMSAALTSVLIYYFAVSLPVASIVAVLIVKRAVLPASEEICSFWSRQLA